MTWKSYAVVSVVTVLAGWLASSPTSNLPAGPRAARPERSAGVSTAASDIAEQAARLQARLRQEAEYRQPERNPFRFGAKQIAPSERAPAVTAPTLPPVELPPGPPPLPVTLSGIAEDREGDNTRRTAVLSSPTGVLLVHEGDDVLGRYRVSKIEPEAVELVSPEDGATTRLTLRPSTKSLPPLSALPTP